LAKIGDHRPPEALCRIRPFGMTPSASQTLAGAGPVSFITSPKRLLRAGRADPIRPSAAGALHPAGEICREYERIVDTKYLAEIRAQAEEFSTKHFARRSRLTDCTIRNFKERERQNQSSFAAKADKGHPCSAEPWQEKLN
jgi:hypothetical protein